MKRKPTRVSVRQRHVLRQVRRALGEKGYFIFPVEKKHRKTSQDFLAVPIGRPINFVLVRPTKDKGISIQPFSSNDIPFDVKEAVGSVIINWQTIVHWKKSIPIGKKDLTWDEFVSAEGRKRVESLQAS